MNEPHVMADIQTGWAAGFDADGEPVFESKGALTHYSVNRNEWLLMVLLAARKAGIERIDFVRGGLTYKSRTATELEAELKAVLS